MQAITPISSFGATRTHKTISFKSNLAAPQISRMPQDVAQAVDEYNSSVSLRLTNLRDRKLLTKIFNNKNLEYNDCREINRDEQAVLGLYFEDIPANDRHNQSYIVKLKSGYVLATRYKEDDVSKIHLTPLSAKRDYGKDPHILGLQYRYHDLSEEEKIQQCRQYRRIDRLRLGKAIPNVSQDRLEFQLPEVKDRPLKIMFLSIYPYENPANPYQSIGPNYIESYLKENLKDDVEIEHLETSIHSNEDIKKRLEDYKPDVIGLSTKVNSFWQFNIWMKYLNEHFKTTPVIVGGQMANSSWGEIIQDYPKSLIMFDNGEVPFYELSKIMLQKSDISNLGEIPNLCFNVDKKPSLTPFKDYNHIVSEHCIPSDTNVEEMLKNNGIIALRLSQGCWGNCSFCTHPGRWQGADLDKIIKVLKEWKEKYNIDSIFFTDDEIVNKSSQEARRRLGDLADKLIKANLDISWTTSLRADSVNWLDSELIEKLKKSGCSSGFLGIESGSNTQLKRYGKPVNGVKVGVDVNSKAVQFYKDNNMTAGIGWICFDPLMPTLRELKENIDFIKENNILDHNIRLDGSMRAQRGANYPIKLAQYNMGLLGDLQPNMFHYDTTYLDPRAGTIREHVVKWHEDIRNFDNEVNNIKFVLACNPKDKDKYASLLDISKRIQHLTIEYIEAMIAMFPEDEDDKVLDGIVSKDENKKQQALKMLQDTQYMKERRQRLLNEVTDLREDLFLLQVRYMLKRNMLIDEFNSLKKAVEA